MLSNPIIQLLKKNKNNKNIFLPLDHEKINYTNNGF